MGMEEIAHENGPEFAEMIDTLRGGHGASSIRPVYVFGKGICVQIFRGSRKCGPIIIPDREKGQTLGEVLKMLGDAIDQANEVVPTK